MFALFLVANCFAPPSPPETTEHLGEYLQRCLFSVSFAGVPHHPH